MQTTQRVIEHLLLVTGAGRAAFARTRPDGALEIEAEAVQHGQRQLRHDTAGASLVDAPTLETLRRDKALLVEDDTGTMRGPNSERIGARMLAPLIEDGRLVGVIALHCAEPRQWSAQDADTMKAAQTRILAVLAERASREPPASVDLRTAATQTILDRLRVALDVQRCTFRQPVQEAFAFPVTFETRAPGMRSLLGDFTIVQTGQPVIVKLLAERKQVVQDDCNIASEDPLFHTMLAHYGGMRAQVVTPFIVGDQLKGVLSIHEVRDVRKWTEAEKALAAQAAALIGALFEAPPR